MFSNFVNKQGVMGKKKSKKSKKMKCKAKKISVKPIMELDAVKRKKSKFYSNFHFKTASVAKVQTDGVVGRK